MSNETALTAQAESPIDALARIANDASVPAEKMQILADILWREQDRQREFAFTESMIALQAEMPRIAQNGRIMNKDRVTIRSKYSKFEDIDKVLRPLAASHGFAYTFGSDIHPTKNETIITLTVRHRLGAMEKHSLALPPDEDKYGNKTDVQARVSSMSFGKRTLLKAAFNIVEEGEDTNGERTATITEDQEAELMDIINAIERINQDRGEKPGTGKALALKFCEVEKLSQIKQVDFRDRKRGLLAALKKREEGK